MASRDILLGVAGYPSVQSKGYEEGFYLPRILPTDFNRNSFFHDRDFVLPWLHVL